jgi:RimJ/RimL family protein N-acetyltransferase
VQGFGVLANLWPLLNLRLATSRLVLRYPNDDELASLALVAAAGVHNPGERPFLTSWTEGTPRQTAVHVVQQHWSRRGQWTPDAWALELGVFRDEQPIGMVALRAHEFAALREVKTESWLGLDYHRQGYGTEARTALLHLAFDGLGAQSARTELFQDNAASQGVSRRLGYQHDGISRDLKDGEVVLSDRLRLNRDSWLDTARASVGVTGLAECLLFFGL